MARKTDIRLRRSDTAGKIPTSANLSDGELALNTNSGALYFKKSDDTIITVHDNTILHIDSDTTVDSETGTAPKIGIGTTSPGFKLDVVGDGRFSGQNNLLYLDSGATGSPQIQFRQGTNRKSYVRYENSRTTFDIVNEFGNVALWTGSSGSEIERLTVDTSGNVGIGTTAPTHKLHVSSGTVNTAVARFTGANNDRGLVISTAVSGITNDSIINYDAVSTNSVGQHAFKTDGTERVRITASGNVGVGTNSPATSFHISESSDQTSPQLRITNDNSESLTIGVVRSVAGTAPDTALIQFDNALRFIGQTGTTNERMRITEAGNVGINTTNPGYKLDVGGSVRFAGSASIVGTLQSYSGVFNVKNIAQDQDLNLQVNDGGTNTTALTVQGTTANVGIGTTSPATNLEISGSAPKLRITDSRNQTFTVGDIMSSIEFDSDDTSGGAGTSSEPRAAINMYAASTFGSSTGLEFRTKSDTTGYPAQQMVIDNTGQVGIGTGTPSELLEVAGDTKVTNLGVNAGPQDYLSSLSARLVVGGNAVINTNSPILYLRANGGSNDSDLRFQNGLKFTNGSAAIQAIIDSGGRVGIKNSSPSSQFFNTLVVGNTSGDNGITIQSSATGRGALAFSDTDTATSGRYDGYINYSHNATYMSFHVNTGNEQMRIDSAGRVLINTTSSVHSAAKLQVVGDTSSFARIALKDADGSSNIAYIDKEGAQLGFTSQNGTSHGTIALKSYDGTSTVSRLTIDQNGAITFNSAFTFPNSIGSAGQVLKVPSSGTTLQWANESGGGGATDGIEDADGDTKIQVEESTDEDIIRFDVAGSEVAFINSTTFDIAGRLDAARDIRLRGSDAAANAGVVRLFTDSNNNLLIDTGNDGSNQFSMDSSGNIDVSGTITAVAGAQDSSAYSITSDGGDLVLKAGADDVVLRTGGSGSEAIYFQDGAQNTKMLVNCENGYVGIGTETPDVKLHLEDASRVDIKFEKTGSETHYIRKDGDYLRFRGHDDSTVLFELQNNTNGSNVSAFPNGNVGIGTTGPSAKLHIVHNDTSDALLLETTEASNLAGPVLTFKRNSASPADADYLGQLKFKGENNLGQEVVYAKMTSKISDQTDGTEDGVIEFAVRKAGSNNINMRLGPNTLQLINGTGLTVAGDATITGNLTVDGTTTTLNTATLDVEDKNITLNYGSGDTSATADGAGITIQDAVDSSTNATILWDGTNDEFDFSHAINTAGAITAQRIIGTQTNGSSLYALELTRSGGGTTTPDLYGTNSTLVLGSSASTEALAFSSADSFFYGNLTIPNKIIHSGDTDTEIVFDTNDVKIKAGGATHFHAASDQTTNLYGGNTLTLTVSADQRVGIGTNSPNNNLTVSGAGDGINIIGTSSYLRWNSGDMMIRNEGSYAMGFHTYDGSSSMVERMRIDSSGRVGIGTTSPTGSNLHIAEAGDPTILLEDTDSSNQVKIRYKTTTTEWTAGLHGGVDKWKIAKAAGFGTNDYLVVDASGRVGIGTDSPAARFQVEEYGIDTTETSTSATTQVAIHTFAATDFRSARFTIQITNSTDSTYHTSEILLVHDGTTAYITEFGEIHTGVAEEATLDADISSGSVRLLATPASTDSMEFKVVCHSVTV